MFLHMVMYDNEFKTKEIEFEPGIILNHNITIPCMFYFINVINYNKLFYT